MRCALTTSACAFCGVKWVWNRVRDTGVVRTNSESRTSQLLPRRSLSPHLQKVRALVGRTQEWQRLTSAWEAAVEEGPRVAIISGEPGIGKTRLADELYQWCVRQGHAAALSRCYIGHRQVAYAPVAEWLRSDAVRAGWTNLRPQQLAELARLAPEVREQFPEFEELRSGQTSPLAESCEDGFISTNRSAPLSEKAESRCCCISTICNGAIRTPLNG